METKENKIKGTMITAKTSLRKKIMILLSALAWKQAYFLMIMMSVFSISKLLAQIVSPGTFMPLLRVKYGIGDIV